MSGTPQQFCLRWNNHQSNIVSVFEQLLHSEAFVDVTLAVEGMSLKAHKVVLSACSPYFQAVLASHPDKHPIVILKDVRYGDMRDLLDFMYRGEVSVDQENLSGFLKVAESLRIKGLTEVNEKKRLENSPYHMPSSGTPTIPVGDSPSVKRTISPNQNSHNKRRRGRPPKISGEDSEGEGTRPNSETNSADGGDEEKSDSVKTIKVETEDTYFKVETENCKDNERSEPAGPSGETVKDEPKPPKEDCDTRESPGSVPIIDKIAIPRLVSIAIPQPKRRRGRPRRAPRIPQDPSKWPPLLPKFTSHDGISQEASTSKIFINPSVSQASTAVFQSNVPSLEISPHFQSTSAASTSLEIKDYSSINFPGGVLPLSVELGVGAERPSERKSELLGVQMGIKVRGLDLMRYGRLENGIYKCSECEKINILKTFKTSYSFQRHAYLYHEGSPKRFPCPQCGKEFSRPDKRKSHLKEKHSLFSSD